jgi:hypothetical protein
VGGQHHAVGNHRRVAGCKSGFEEIGHRRGLPTPTEWESLGSQRLITNGWRLRSLRSLRRTCSASLRRSPAWKRYTASAPGLQAFQELVVIGVGADPEPDPDVIVSSGESSVVEGDAC